MRQADAHAWSEIWIKGQGWIRIDPTASVSPLRVENGVNGAFGPIGILPSLIEADRTGLIGNMRYAWHALNSQWDEWVVGYNLDRQRQFFSNMGYPSVDWQTLGFWLMAAIIASAARSPSGCCAYRPPRREPRCGVGPFLRQVAAAGLGARLTGPIDYRCACAPSLPAAARQRGITRRYFEGATAGASAGAARPRGR